MTGKIRDKDLLLPLNKLLAANERLDLAIQGTRKAWPYLSKCWIDQLSEPTPLLASHNAAAFNGKAYTPEEK